MSNNEKSSEKRTDLLARVLENIHGMTEEETEKAHLDASILESAYNLGRASVLNGNPVA